MWTNEIKTKTKASHVIFKLTTGSIVRFIPQTCNGIIKGWLHCLASVSKRRFFVNSISVWLSIMSGHGANPIFFNKKKKRLEVKNTRQPSTSLHPITSHFCLTPSHPPLKVDVICVLPLKTWNMHTVLYEIFFI